MCLANGLLIFSEKIHDFVEVVDLAGDFEAVALAIRDEVASLHHLLQQAIQQANPEKQVKKMEAIILSMTLKERRNPDLMNPSRKKRIAAGCGMDVAEVNKLIKQHAQMAKMMKKFANPSGIGKMMRSLSGMQKQFGGGGGMGPLFGNNDQKK